MRSNGTGDKVRSRCGGGPLSSPPRTATLRGCASRSARPTPRRPCATTCTPPAALGARPVLAVLAVLTVLAVGSARATTESPHSERATPWGTRSRGASARPAPRRARAAAPCEQCRPARVGAVDATALTRRPPHASPCSWTSGSALEASVARVRPPPVAAPAAPAPRSCAQRPREEIRAGPGKGRPPPPPRTKWTRRVPHPVLIGHAESLGRPPSPRRLTRGCSARRRTDRSSRACTWSWARRRSPARRCTWATRAGTARRSSLSARRARTCASFSTRAAGAARRSRRLARGACTRRCERPR